MLSVSGLKLTNFRCYEDIKMSFSPGINILIGKNGAGKTTIIEALGFLFVGKSFKKTKESDCLSNEKEYFCIAGDCLNDEKSQKIVFYYDEGGKKISINEKKVQKMSAFVSQKAFVCFSPDDLYIIKGSPLERRRFLDVSISQIDSEYIDFLNRYNKIIKQRNEYLKSLDENALNYDFLDVLDFELLSCGKQIIKKRQKFVTHLCKYINIAMDNLSNNNDSLELVYSPKVKEEDFEKEFIKRRKHDIFLQTTTLGPHRDDLIFVINDKNATDCASQGQIRCAVLALIISYYRLLKEINKPLIVAMDDVLSELDEERKNKVFSVIEDGDQVFITCTDLSNISNEIVAKSNVINIRKD